MDQLELFIEDFYVVDIIRDLKQNFENKRVPKVKNRSIVR